MVQVVSHPFEFLDKDTAKWQDSPPPESIYRTYSLLCNPIMPWGADSKVMARKQKYFRVRVQYLL